MMAIDWNIVATIVAPLLALFVGAFISRVFESRPRLITYLGYVSSHRIEPESGVSFDVFTHSIVLKNAGRRPARNVRITHTILPNFSVFPSIPFTVDNLPDGEIDIVLPVLVPNQEITISYLYYPPTTWDRINGPIKSDEGFAKTMRVMPVVQFSPWVNAIAAGLMLTGAIALIYSTIEVLQRLI